MESLLKLVRTTIIIFIVCIFNPGEINSQTYKIDSLEREIARRTGKEKLRPMVKLAIQLASIDPRRMQQLASRISSEAREFSDTLFWIKGERLLAAAYRRLEKMDSSNFVSLRILPIARKESITEYGWLLNGLALGQMYYGQYDLSLKCFFELYDIAVSQKDTETISSTLNNIGLVYYKLENFTKAIDYFEKASRDCAKEDLIHRHINLTLCYIYTNRLSLARQFILKMQNGEEAEEYRLDILHAWGRYYLQRHDTDSAMLRFTDCLREAEKRKSIEYQIVSSAELAEIFAGKKEIDRAENYFTKAATIAAYSTYAEETMSVFRLTGKFYEQKGDLAKSLTYYKKHLALKDSIYGKGVLNKLITIENDFISRQKDIEIMQQKELLESQRLKAERRKIITLFSLAFCILLILLLASMYRLYRRKRVDNRILESKVESRTRELEALYVESEKRLQNELTLYRRRCKQFEDTVLNIAAVCDLGMKDESKNLYFEKIKVVTDGIFQASKRD